MSEKADYKKAGVNLAAADKTVRLMAEAVESTYTPQVLAGLGSFGGLFELPLGSVERPVLVASTDGVGTKTKVATALNDVSGLGADIVHHCINDILVQGAKPLFFLDYIASSKLEPEVVSAVVISAAEACRAAGVVLLGGETAEMPGVYESGELDLVGTIVGLVDRSHIVDGSRIRPGDKIIALMSGGLQTNGYSLARQLLDGSYQRILEGKTLGEWLLVPHRSYLDAVGRVASTGHLRGMAHITGGGIPGNLPRVLPAGLSAKIHVGSWPLPAIFEHIRARGVSDDEMYKVFNMGAGFLLISPEQNVPEILDRLDEPAYVIGDIKEGSGVSLLKG